MAQMKDVRGPTEDLSVTNGAGSLTLSAADEKNLVRLDQKLQLVRDFTTSVATCRTTGFYLHGSGGCGKSFTVLDELERRKVPYKIFNSRMTGRGLYNALEEFPDAIHVLEDMEQLFRESGARGVLRSALWSQPAKDGRGGPIERWITWTTYKQVHSFVFTGGLIMMGNRPFPTQPELEAIKTRIEYMHLVVSENELKALMRKVSLRGYRRGHDVLDPSECLDVCEFIIDECRGLHRSLDMRLLVNSFQDHLQWRDCQAGCHWHDLVSTRVKERPITLEEARSIQDRTVQKEQELAIAGEIRAATTDRAERFRLWHEKTKKSEPTLYRRLFELDERMGFADSQRE